MLCVKTEPIPIECVVRGYLAGSGLKEYRPRQAHHLALRRRYDKAHPIGLQARDHQTRTGLAATTVLLQFELGKQGKMI